MIVWTTIIFPPRGHIYFDFSSGLPHNAQVTRVKSVIGIGTPDVTIGAQNRLSFTRQSGFFVRAHHLMGEACGQLRAGRYLWDGVPTRSASPTRLEPGARLL